MTPKQFEKYLVRDYHCYHCGTSDETLIPQHRAGRGHGGSKAANQPANVIVLCSAANSLLESDATFAQLGRQHGWKLSRYADPLVEPVFDVLTETWFVLDNKYGRTIYSL